MIKANRRGRPLAAIILILSAWTLMRTLQVVSDQLLSDDGHHISIETMKLAKISEHIEYDSAVAKKPDHIPVLSREVANIVSLNADAEPLQADNLAPEFWRLPPVDVKAGSKRDQKTPHAQPPYNPETFSLGKRFGFYGYSYWRGGSQQNGLAAAGQYGGSQSGIIIDYRLTARPNGPKIFSRATIAPSQSNSTEISVGVKEKPITKIPLTIAVERRIRESAPDVFAVYAAGGVNKVKLPLQFDLEAYGQAGLIRGKVNDRFFDAAVRVDRPLALLSGFKLRCGLGGWSGGQRGSGRLDIGPSIRTDLSVGNKAVRLSADYRIRVLGDAFPENGPAISLSTGF